MAALTPARWYYSDIETKGFRVSIFTDLFGGPDAPFYTEHEGGPLVARLSSGIAPAEAASALEDMKAAYLALMEQEGVSDPRELLTIKRVTPLHLEAAAAAERVQDIFAMCDGYLADWTGGKNVA